MTPPSEPSSQMHTPIDEMAAEWLAWRDTGLSAQQAVEFARWRAADPRHDEAIRRIEAAQTLLARLPESPDAAVMYAEIDQLYSAHRERTWRKRWIGGAVGLAAAAALALALWWPQRGPDATIYQTTAEAPSRIDLPDGSTLALSADSEVRVDFADRQRRLDLTRGEAHFAVAKDTERPFVVSIGTVTVQAVGTAFTIRRSEAGVDVLVTEGKVLVTHAETSGNSSSPLAPFSLIAGERARIPTLPGAGSHETIVVKSERADPATLVFANTSLAEAVERFNRHSRVQMEIGDPELREKMLGGTFNADNAEAFIHLLVASGEVAVERVSETHVVLRAVRGKRLEPGR